MPNNKDSRKMSTSRSYCLNAYLTLGDKKKVLNISLVKYFIRLEKKRLT